MPLQNLNPSDVKAALDADEIILIDVREPNEWTMGHIAGALHFPLSSFDPTALPVDEHKAIVFYCAAGVRSAKAADYCQHMGVDVTRHLAGGIHAWVGAGLPVV